jgi:transcriptional regulator with XRE-family HTH domain
MITPFGKELRKIRLDRDMFLKNMADELGFTSSYLSAIENGKKKIPNDFIQILEEKFQLSTEEIYKLKDAQLASQKIVEFDTQDMEDYQKDFVISFARRFEELPQETIENFKKMLDDFERSEDNE